MDDCKHLIGKACDLASQLAGKPVEPHKTACDFCTLKCDPPRSINRVTVSIAISSLHQQDAKRQELLNTYGHLLPHADPPQSGDKRLAAVINGHGPGSQLWKLLESLGVKHTNSCSCISRAEQMNAWGVAGCRDHRDEILGWMREGQDQFGWREKLTAATRAVTTGLAFRLNPLDPFPGILDEAIRRAEAAAQQVGSVRKDAEFGRLVGPVAQVRPEKLILKCNLCPGDILTLTAAVESLHRTYPGQYVTDVRTPAKEIWHANPHVTTILDSEPGVRAIDMHYPSINRCNQEAIPFLGGYTEYLAEQLGRPLRLQTNRPHIYMSAQELAEPPCHRRPVLDRKCRRQKRLHLQSLAHRVLPGGRGPHPGQDPLGPDRPAGTQPSPAAGRHVAVGFRPAVAGTDPPGVPRPGRPGAGHVSAASVRGLGETLRVSGRRSGAGHLGPVPLPAHAAHRRPARLLPALFLLASPRRAAGRRRREGQEPVPVPGHRGSCPAVAQVHDHDPSRRSPADPGAILVIPIAICTVARPQPYLYATMTSLLASDWHGGPVHVCVGGPDQLYAGPTSDPVSPSTR